MPLKLVSIDARLVHHSLGVVTRLKRRLPTFFLYDAVMRRSQGVSDTSPADLERLQVGVVAGVLGLLERPRLKTV